MITMKRLTLAASAAALALMLAACSQEETTTAEQAPAAAPVAEAPAEPAPAPAETAAPAAEPAPMEAAAPAPAEPAPIEAAPAPAEPAAAPAPMEAAAPASGQTSLKIGSEAAYPPFNNLAADGKLEGFDIDIANALCAEMKITCEFVTQDWDGMIPALQAGKFDAIISSMSITDERKKQVDFTDKYYNTPPAIAVPKDSAIADIKPESLAGKTLGVASSTTHSNFAERDYKTSTIKMYPTSDEFFLELVNGRVDAVMDDISVIEGWLAKPDGACCKIIGTVKQVPEIHGFGAGIALRKGETELAERFNTAIDAIRANGKYKEINDKYFTYDVYGG